MQHGSLPQSASKSALDTICPKNQGALRLGGDVRLSKGRMHEVQGDSADIFAIVAAANLNRAHRAPRRHDRKLRFG